MAVGDQTAGEVEVQPETVAAAKTERRETVKEGKRQTAQPDQMAATERPVETADQEMEREHRVGVHHPAAVAAFPRPPRPLHFHPILHRPVWERYCNFSHG
jgi:hypothetical protein